MSDSSSIDYVTSAGIEADPAANAAQLACEDLVKTSLLLIDGGKASKVRALFTEDGAHTLNDTEFQGPKLTQFFDDREAMVGRDTRHTVMNMTFRRVSEDRAEIRSICVVYLLSLETDADRRLPRGIVDFHDYFVRSGNGQWRFTRREAQLVAGER